jgi:hypothetical protein
MNVFIILLLSTSFNSVHLYRLERVRKPRRFVLWHNNAFEMKEGAKK